MKLNTKTIERFELILKSLENYGYTTMCPLQPDNNWDCEDCYEMLGKLGVAPHYTGQCPCNAMKEGFIEYEALINIVEYIIERGEMQ